MKDWNNVGNRKQAVRLFVEYLHDPNNKKERDRCTTDRVYAKQLFARLGDFGEQLPEKMEFRVYEDDPVKLRDEDLATIVLPSPDKDPHPIDVGQVHRCTWVDWTS